MSQSAPPFLSLACGSLPTTEHTTIVEAAARAGFDGVGLEVPRSGWTDQTTRDVKSALANHPIRLLDVEALLLIPGMTNDALYEQLDIAAELSASYACTISLEPETAVTEERLTSLCNHAQERGITLAIEFMRFFSIKDLNDARYLIDALQHPALAVLIDTLHFYRCGHQLDELKAISPGLIPYVQICDAAAQPPGEDDASLMQEAFDLRCQLGEGSLPISDFLATLPGGTPLSIEMRSEQVRNRWPDPFERTQAIKDATTRFLSAA